MLRAARAVRTDLARLLRRPARERRLLAAAWLGLVLSVLALRVLPFRTVRRLSRSASGSSGSDRDDAARERAGGIARAVRVAGRRVPGGDGCLPRALTAAVLLRRAGLPATVRIGVRRSGSDAGTHTGSPAEIRSGSARPVVAHAWVTCGDRVVVGDRSDLASFRTLGAID